MDGIKIVTEDGKEFFVDRKAVEISETLKNLIEDVNVETGIVLPNISADIFGKIIEYCQYHVANSETEEWDKEFVKMDQKTLFLLISAVNYLDIKPLLELTCKKVADMMKGKTTEEMRKLFDIESDFTLEEEEKIRKEFEWVNESN